MRNLVSDIDYFFVYHISCLNNYLIKNKPKEFFFFPFIMWLYPLPALVAILMWIGLFLSTGMYFALGGVLVMSAGAVVYFIRSYYQKSWPFNN